MEWLYITSHSKRESLSRGVSCGDLRFCFVPESRMHQVIVSASGPISGSHSGSLFFHDISTGTSLASFKQSTAAKNCTALIGTTPTQGGLILAVQPDKALLNVHSFQKVLLHIQTRSICDLTSLVLRTKYPSKSFSQNVFPA